MDDNPPNTPASPITPVKPARKASPSATSAASSSSSIPSYAKPTFAIQSRLPTPSVPSRTHATPRSILKPKSGGVEKTSPRPIDSSSPLPSRAAAITERLTSTTPIPYTDKVHSRHSSGSTTKAAAGGASSARAHVRGKVSGGGGSTGSKIPTLDWAAGSSNRRPSVGQGEAEGDAAEAGAEQQEEGVAAVLASAKQAQAMAAEVQEEEAKSRPPPPRGHSRGASVIPTSLPASMLPDPLDADLLDDIDVDTDLDAAFDEAPLPLPADDVVESHSAAVQRSGLAGGEESGVGGEERAEFEEQGKEEEEFKEAEEAAGEMGAEDDDFDLNDDDDLPINDSAVSEAHSYRQPQPELVEMVSAVTAAAAAEESKEDGAKAEEAKALHQADDADHLSAPPSEPPTPLAHPVHSSPIDTSPSVDVQPPAATHPTATTRDSVSSDAGVDGSFSTIIIDRDPMDKLDPEAPTPVTRTPNVTISADDTPAKQETARQAAEALLDAGLLPTRTPAVSAAVPAHDPVDAVVPMASVHPVTLVAVIAPSAHTPTSPTTPTKQVAFKEEVSAVDAPHSLDDLLDDSDLFGDDPTAFPSSPDRVSVVDEPAVAMAPIPAPSAPVVTAVAVAAAAPSEPLAKLREAEAARRAEEDRKAQQSALAVEAAARRAALDQQEEAKYQREKEQLAKEKVALQLEESKQQLFAAFADGLTVTKLGKKGSPRLTRVYIRQEGGRWVVGWDSKKKAAGDAQIPLSDAKCVVGADEGMFLHRKYAGRFDELKGKCVSVVSPVRGLDVVLHEEVEVNQWVAMMRLLNVKVVEN